MNVQKTGVVDMRTATTLRVHLDARARNITEETDFNVSVSNNNSVSFALHTILTFWSYRETCVKRPLSKTSKIGFQDQLLLDAGQKGSILQ